MDIAARKRVISSNLDGPAAKVQAAIQAPEPPSSFVDILFVNLLNALNITEPSQRLPFIDDMLQRLTWLKKFQEQHEAQSKKPSTSDKSPAGSPRQPEPHKPMDHQNMRKCIEKERDMLQNMSKLIGIAGQGPPMIPNGPPILAPQAPKILAPAPPPEAKKSPIPPPRTIADALAPPPAPSTPMPVLTPKVRKMPEKKGSPPPQIPQFPYNSAKHAEEMILDIQEKQRKLLNYISVAHGGKVTDEVLHDYLRHPYVLLKENGQTRKQQNPFYHLMGQNGQPMRMMPPMPPPAVINKPQETSKPSTPIPAPPVLLPQVELPRRSIKQEVSPPPDKISPPPHLPLQVPLLPAQYDPAKPFVMPVTRDCNQWSVVSMALPLRLLCRCYQNPCRCQQ